MNLQLVYDALPVPVSDGGPTYSVREIEGASSYLIGKDHACRPALLVRTASSGRSFPAIKLQAFEAYFSVLCTLQDQDLTTTSARIAVVRCPAQDEETVRFFLSVCSSLIGLVGVQPDPDNLWRTADRIASLFQKLLRPPTRSVNGLFGELFTIFRSVDPVAMAQMWRADPQSRFDFSNDVLRLDVKTTTGRLRSHVLSFEQANSPAGTLAIVASMFVERVGRGFSLSQLLSELEAMLAANPNLLIKLQEQTAEALGNALKSSLEIQFDIALSRSSFRLFRTSDIPAIRGELPVGVSAVHFTSDFSGIEPVQPSELVPEAKEASCLVEAAEVKNF